MKRFWKDVGVERDDDGWSIRLDGRPVRTPARALMTVPSRALADAVMDEWRAVDEKIDPRMMPLTGLANAAIDRVAPQRQEFARGLARYAEADLICYRAEGPCELVATEDQEWNALLAWARRRYDVDLLTTFGLIHVEQPRPTVERLSQAVFALDPFELAGLSPLVTIGGSLVAALAVIEKMITADQAWQAVSVDERWQLDQWGNDADAQAALLSRERDFATAGRFLQLLD